MTNDVALFAREIPSAWRRYILSAASHWLPGGEIAHRAGDRHGQSFASVARRYPALFERDYDSGRARLVYRLTMLGVHVQGFLRRDRDAAPRKAEGFEAVGQQPGPKASPDSIQTSPTP